MRVLVTYGWCRTAYAAAESLCRAGMEVFACGSSPLCMTRVSRFVRAFDRVPDPFLAPDQYVSSLREIVGRRKIDVLLPIHEDALVIARRRNHLPSNLIIACPRAADLELALDKYKIIRVAQRAGVDCPETTAPADLAEALRLLSDMPYPLVIKTRRGNSGKGVFIVRCAEDAIRTYRDVVRRFGLDSGEMPLIQAYVEGQVWGSCFLAQEGRMLACFSERYVRCKDGGFGTSVEREPCKHDELHDATNKLVAALNWTGIGHFDFILERDSGSPMLIEMNPRMWGALSMAIRNGYDFPQGLVTMHAEGRTNPAAFQPKAQSVCGLWIVGEMIAAAVEMRHGMLWAPLASLRRILGQKRPCSYDDFQISDPLPLFVEMLYYATGFLRSKGSTNPESVAMMRN